MSDARPFLKWSGGKRQLLPELRKRAPKDPVLYYEPFLGGGALFFALQPRCAFLSDTNRTLVRTYTAVRDDVEQVIRLLKRYAEEHALHGAPFYYHVRGLSDATWPDVDAAARMIYLNKTCFNGLWRVNSSGAFNVPIGKSKSPPMICDEDNLRACSVVLKRAQIVERDFRTMCPANVRNDAFWYADPPYVPLTATSSFTAYTAEGFGHAEQVALRDLAWKLKTEQGVHVLLSNSTAPVIEQLYAGFTIEKVPARRSVNSKADGRGAIMESLIW